MTLCAVAFESGDVFRRGVFDIFTAAAKHMTEEQFDVVFEHINGVDRAAVDVPLLTLITTLTKQALIRNAEVRPSACLWRSSCVVATLCVWLYWLCVGCVCVGAQSVTELKSYGVDLLWEIASTPSAVHEEVTAEATKSVIDMFAGRPDLIEDYVTKCVDRVTAKAGVLKALTLLRQLIETLPIHSVRTGAGGRNVGVWSLSWCDESASRMTYVCVCVVCASVPTEPFASQRNAVAYLVRHYSIVDVVLADLSAYKAEAREAFFTWLSVALEAAAASRAPSVADEVRARCVCVCVRACDVRAKCSFASVQC